MKLPLNAIKDFQEAHYKDFGESITEEEAAMLGERLINLMASVWRPINNHP